MKKATIVLTYMLFPEILIPLVLVYALVEVIKVVVRLIKEIRNDARKRILLGK
jgi:hypothetical protein